MAKHSLLSASASHRWLNCPPSARLCEKYEDKPSEYAQEGTDCHELCAYKVEKALGRRVRDPTENLTYCQRQCDFVVFRRTGNVGKWRVNMYSL